MYPGSCTVMPHELFFDTHSIAMEHHLPGKRWNMSVFRHITYARNEVPNGIHASDTQSLVWWATLASMLGWFWPNWEFVMK